MKTLVIVESPGKIKKINYILGKDYIVKASFGHIMDLDKKTLSIDINNNFEPYYITLDDKKKLVNDLLLNYSKCDDVIIASDLDREGEAIGFQLKTILKLSEPKRIIFNEITHNAIHNAINNPTKLNYDMINAQKTRRILDRLVGYLISPIISKFINNAPQSAGRVQSTVLNIINEKEDEIKNTILEKSYKIISNLKINDYIFKSSLDYDFKNEENIINFINLINKNTIIKINNITTSDYNVNPPPPFITSSLQQEAFFKLKFSIKKTMDIAQKLYEDGHITYMRTDSLNLSNEAINKCKNYIIKNYDEKYLHIRKFSNNINSQEAHECIRPTNIENIELNYNDESFNSLYKLIWNRTICSQMTSAKFNKNKLDIDIINENKSILLFDNIQYYFNSIFNNLIFDGFLIINKKNSIENIIDFNLSIDDNLLFQNLIIFESFNNPPNRFNEASLVSYLEKNNIGRPSTYVSIINKLFDRNYITYYDNPGINKEYIEYNLDNEYKYSKNIKNIIIGEDKNKIIPTNLGILINNFMKTYFSSIIDINFTSNFESYLDNIANGKSNWINILKLFYDSFNPIVENLKINIPKSITTDYLLGSHNNIDIYKGIGKYGPYLKYDENNKIKYMSINNYETITLENAISLIQFPKLLGKIKNAHITLNKNNYGYFIKYLKNIYPIDDNININDINIDYAKDLINNKINNNKVFNIDNNIIHVKKGIYGPYLQINNKKNIAIPKNYDSENLNLEDVLKIIASKNGTRKKINKK
jgi:DNA topoisomerase I